MEKDAQTNDNERAEAINWMRNVLTSMLEVCPLSYQQKKVAGQALNKIPDWLMGRWADGFNIDYMGDDVIEALSYDPFSWSVANSN